MKRNLLLLPFFLFLFQNIWSASPPSADVTYRHLKNLEYEVTVVAYRDCRATPLLVFDLTIANDSFSVTTKPTRVKIEDVATYCNSKPCNPANTTTGNEGLEAHYLMDTIDFNSGVFKKFNSKNYCNVSFALSTCCRNGIFTGNLFVEAMLNLCLAKNGPVSTPKFLNNIVNYLQCNQTFSYSFYTDNSLTSDSVSYELVKAKNDLNVYEYYGGWSEKRPFTPYCTPPGSYNCTPTTTNPVRGTSFNPINGNFLVTPINCSEASAIVCQVNLFRKDSGKYKLVGYSKRDMRLFVMTSTINKPTLNTYRDYTIKAREKYCVDIKIKDDTTKTSKDTVKLVVKEFPKYGKLTLLDSNEREKTMHYCWDPTDADFLNKKETNIAIYAYDKPCKLSQSMSTVINFKVVAPDSFTDITIKTFYDINKNGKKDIGEPFRSAPVLSEIGGSQNHLTTDNTGSYTMKPFFGAFKFNIDRSQFLYTTSADTILNSKFDSSHTVLLGFNYQQGLKGKVFEDNNNNCVFDAGDAPVRGLKVFSKNTNTLALTDIKGEYLLNGFNGQHVLVLDSNSIYTSTCSPSYKASIVNDSQFSGYDFPLQKKTGFSDISIVLNPARHVRDGSQMTQNIVVENKGNVNVRNFYVQLLTSKKLFQFSSPQSTFLGGDTILWYIDSIVKGTRRTLDFSHTLMAGSYKNGDRITYQLWASNKDKFMSNNYYELTETVDSQNCCATAKTVFAPDVFYPLQPTLTYRLYFKPTVNSKRALISDVIDTNRFDLHSLRILTSNVSLNTYVKGNVLYGDNVTGNFLSNAELIYSIALKTPLKDSFTVRNTGACDLDYQTKTAITNTTATKIVSPVVYEQLTKTTYCAGEVMTMGFSTNYKPDAGNRFKVFLSDSNGQFGQPSLLLDTASNFMTNVLRIKIPSVYNSHTYQVKITGSSPALEAFASVGKPSITIHPLPAIQFTTNLTNGKICTGDSIRISAKGAFKYSFIKYGNAQPPFGFDSVRTDVMRTNAVYQVAFQSKQGCLNTSSPVTVGLYSLPEILLDPAYTILCEGEKLSLLFSGAGNYSLYRNKTIKVLSGLSSSPAIITPPVGQSYYTMTGSDNNGCRDTSDRIFVQVNPLPAKPVITRLNKSIRSNYSYGNQWYNLNGKIDSAVNTAFYPPKDGSYFVRHTDSNGCENTSDLFVVNFTSLSNISDISGLFVYPNPAYDLLNIANPNSSAYHYILYDAFGKKIMEGKSAQALEKLDVSSFSSGHYMLNIITSEGTGNLKITVLH